MKYPYHVFHNGVSYAPFEEVPDGKENPVDEIPVAESVTENQEEKTLNPEMTVIDEQLGLKEHTEPPKRVKLKYTRNEVKRLTVAEAKEYAIELGINPDDYRKTVGLKNAIVIEMTKKASR